MAGKTADTYHLEYGYSCMGYEIAAAIGAKIAMPHQPVYAMVGDGSYMMLHSELHTAVQEGLKLPSYCLITPDSAVSTTCKWATGWAVLYREPPP